ILLYNTAATRYPSSNPPRRPSDPLPPDSLFFHTNQVLEQLNQFARIIAAQPPFDQKAGVLNLDTQLPPRLPVDPKRRLFGQKARSEEHTSELQSRENLVFRLLLVT